MNRKRIIEALNIVNSSRVKLGLDAIAFAHDASTAVLNGLLKRSWLSVRNAADDGFAATGYDCELTIHGQIGTDYYGDQGYSAKQYQDELKPMAGKKVLLNIHSPGGNVWDAFAMAEMNRAHGGVDTKVLGLAASSGDVLLQSGKTRYMPKMAMRMAHNPSALFIAHGNADELEAQKAEFDKTIGRLKKHGDTLANMYANRNSEGRTVDEIKADMGAEEFMDGDESLEKGYCDCLTDDMPVTDALDLSHLKKVPSQIQNKFTALPTQGERNQPTNQQQDTTVNKKQKIALLNQWGVKLPAGITEETVTDAWLDEELGKGKPAAKISRDQNVALLNSWGVKFEATAKDDEIENLVATGKPKATASAGNVVDFDNHPEVKRMKALNDQNRKENLRTQILALASSEGGMKIPLNSVDKWVDRAFAASEDANGINPVVNDLKALEAKPVGVPSISAIVVGDTQDPKEISKAVTAALAPRNAMLSKAITVANRQFREELGLGAKKINKIVNKVIDVITAKIPENPPGQTFYNKQRATVIAEYLDSPIMNDAQQGPYGSVTVSSDLQRQVIMSEAMRAFKRRLYPLMSFAHNFNSVPLQGKDEIDVPYYPLFTTQSQRFIAPGAAGAAAGTTGYQFSGTDQEFRKQILVGGAGQNAKIAGQDRAYQALTLSSYLLRRQPWVDVIRLAVMRAEQLALDILNDIFTAWVLKANFGNAVWSGLPAAFDDTTVAFLQGVAEKADWPEAMRNLVIGTDYYTNLASSPYVKAFLNIGDTNTIREGKIGGLYGFEDTIGSPRIPATTDGNLVGFISYPSAVLVATSPILPAPGVMKLLVNYDLVVDEDTGLAFEYKYWGDLNADSDREIIESNYGSGLGELAALKRLVANGN